MPAHKLPSSSVKKQVLPLNIILLGDPAAGKATQSQLLIKKYRLVDFDMGKELMRLRKQHAAVDERLKHNNDKGKLTPTDIVRGILRQTIAATPMQRGILFDGHPKMIGEAKLVKKLISQTKRREPIVLYLSVPLEETVKRMHDRKGYFKGKFGKRADDSDSGLKNRVRYYRTNISQVVEFFKINYKFKKVSGMGSVDEVHKRMLEAIAELTA